jgi:poly(A) polymerase
MHIDEEILNLLKIINGFFKSKRIQAFLVGGFVRDILLDRQTNDIDIAFAGDLTVLGRELADFLNGRYVLLDEENGIARVVVFRNSPEQSVKKQWYVDVSAFNGDITDDLRDRDFTIDAMAINLSTFIESPFSAEIIDPSGGRFDIDKGRIKQVSPEVFNSDPLRLLRAVRLKAEIGFEVEEETEKNIRQDSSLINNSAAERIREEMVKILAAARGGDCLQYMDKLGLLTEIIPELEVMRGVEQPVEHHWDVYDHSLETVKAVEFIYRQKDLYYAPARLLEGIYWSNEIKEFFNSFVSENTSRLVLNKLAALLHDIAKPQTKIIADNGKIRFYGHAGEGAEKAVEILERLRFSRKEINLVSAVIRHHMRPTQMSNEGLPSRRAVYRFFRDTAGAGLDVLFLSLADHLAARGPNLDSAQWERHVSQVNYILNEYFTEHELITPPKLVDGHDLIRLFDMKPGRKLGETLEKVQEAQASGEIKNRDEALSYIKNRLI